MCHQCHVKCIYSLFDTGDWVLIPVWAKNLVMELVNIYVVLSCYFVEIMRLCVVSVCIN